MLARWAVVAVAVPLAAAGARKLGQRLESNRGPSTLTRGLGKIGELGRR